MAADFQKLQAAHVVAGHDADWFGQLTNPLAEPLFDFGDIRGATFAKLLGAIDIACVFLLGDDSLELLFAPVGPIESSVTAKRELFETTFQKMLGSEARDERLISFDVGQIEI